MGGAGVFVVGGRRGNAKIFGILGGGEISFGEVGFGASD